MNPVIDKMIDVYGQEGYRFWFENQSRGLMIRRFDEPSIDLDDPDVVSHKKHPFGHACTTDDVEVFQRFAGLIDARNIFVIGNAWGFSTFCLAEIFPQARVDAIDAEDLGNEVFRPFLQKFTNLARTVIAKHYPDRVKLTIGYSPQDTPKAIRPNTKYDVVFIDGDHTNEAIVADYFGIKEHLSDKCIVFFHDTILFGLGNGMNEIWADAKQSGFDYTAMDVEGSSFGMGVIARGVAI